MSNVIPFERKYSAPDCLRTLASRIESGEIDASHVVVGVLDYKGEVMAFGFGSHCDRSYEAVGILQAAQTIILVG